MVDLGVPAEEWKLTQIENPTGSAITGDFELSVAHSRGGVHIAASSDITYYLDNPAARPRSYQLVGVAEWDSHLATSLGLNGLVGF